MFRPLPNRARACCRGTVYYFGSVETPVTLIPPAVIFTSSLNVEIPATTRHPDQSIHYNKFQCIHIWIIKSTTHARAVTSTPPITTFLHSTEPAVKFHLPDYR